MKFQMQAEVDYILDKIITLIKNQEFDQAEPISLILHSQEFLKLIHLSDISKLKSTQSQVTFALGLLNTQKALILDELTLIQKAKKSVAFYG